MTDMERCGVCGHPLAKTKTHLDCRNENCPRFLRSIPRHEFEFVRQVQERVRPPAPTIKETLEESEAWYRDAVETVEYVRGLRNDAIRQALAEGWTHARISEATGLTRGRIGQIAQASEKR